MRRRAVSCAWPTVADDGTLTLRLRMPDCLADQHGKYLTIEGVRFAYGHEQVLAAHCRATPSTLGTGVSMATRQLARPNWAKPSATGSSGTRKGWRVFATTQMMDVAVVTDKRRGAIGVDLNADHLAVC